MKEFDLHLHVKTMESDKLLLLLHELTGIKETVHRKSVSIEIQHLLPGTERDPDYLVVSQSSENWYCVKHNSFKKLHNWGRLLSGALDTLFLQVAYRRSDSYSYFLAYERGVRIREIEASALSEVPVMNEGILFPFEDPHADGICGFDIRMFDRDSLEDYCIECGVDLNSLQLSFYSQVIRRQN